MRQSFVMRADWQPLFDTLPDKDAAELIRAIYNYQLHGTEPDSTWSVYPTFLMLKVTMDKDIKAYQEKVERVKKNRSKSDDDINMKSDRNHDDISMKSDRNKDEVSGDATYTYTYTHTDTLTDTDTLKTKKKKEFKEKYGEFGNVSLTVKEREKLITEYGRELTEKAIEYLDGYIEDKGYKSKSNYLTIRRWVIDAVKEKERASPKEKFDLDAYLLERIGEED